MEVSLGDCEKRVEKYLLEEEYIKGVSPNENSFYINEKKSTWFGIEKEPFKVVLPPIETELTFVEGSKVYVPFDVRYHDSLATCLTHVERMAIGGLFKWADDSLKQICNGSYMQTKYSIIKDSFNFYHGEEWIVSVVRDISERHVVYTPNISFDFLDSLTRTGIAPKTLVDFVFQ